MPMLLVYDNWKYFYSYSAGIDFRHRRQIHTSVDPRAVRLRYWVRIPALWDLSLGMCMYSAPNSVQRP